MGKVYSEIDDRLAQFIKRQRLFFVATAPLAQDGLVNASPKGLDSFIVLDPKTVAYLDLTGSGIETVSHLRENGRIVILFCAFEGPPNILRLHGKGEVIEPGDPEFDELYSQFSDYPGTRSIIRVRLQRIADSCGFSVPRYQFESDRAQLQDWANHKGPQGLRDYKKEKNQQSIDGLPGLRFPESESK